jgi:hypothetical protein
LALSDATAFEYTARVGGMGHCGRWRIRNVARLAPRGGGGQAPLAAAADVDVSVEGCPLPLEAAMGLYTTSVFSDANWTVSVAPSEPSMRVHYLSSATTPLVVTNVSKGPQSTRRFVAGTIRRARARDGASRDTRRPAPSRPRPGGPHRGVPRLPRERGPGSAGGRGVRELAAAAKPLLPAGPRPGAPRFAPLTPCPGPAPRAWRRAG